nr:DUF4123 domain-containing protein [Brenneria roseae]
MKDLRHHLRKYLQVLLPSEDKPVFFRFYDPRNIWDLCHVLSEWELHCFMGPIEKMMTVHNGTIREEHFQPVRAQFPPTAKSRIKFLKISQPQLDLLNHCAEVKYIEGLTAIASLITPLNRLIWGCPTRISAKTVLMMPRILWGCTRRHSLA